MGINKINYSISKRFFFFNIELKMLVFKYLLFYFKTVGMRNILNLFIFKIPFDYFFTRISSICVNTGRQGSVYRFFRMSRIGIRDFSGNNLFFGIRKSS